MRMYYSRFFRLVLCLTILCVFIGCGASVKENTEAKLDSMRADSIRAVEKQRQQDSIKVAEILLTLDKDIHTKKKQMLELYPDFGSVNNINSKTATRAVDYLESGEENGSVSVEEGVELELLYIKANIDTWYVNELNKALTLATKVELANEYIELIELTKHVGSVFRILGDPMPVSHGPSGDGASGELCVYELWYKSIKAEMCSSERVTSDEAVLFVDKMRKKWNKIYKDYAGTEEEYELSYLEQEDIEVKQALNTLSSLTKEKQPYKWFVDACSKSLDKPWGN